MLIGSTDQYCNLKKAVGTTIYNLIPGDQNDAEGKCKNSCVYAPEKKPEKKFCFAVGNQEVKSLSTVWVSGDQVLDYGPSSNNDFKKKITNNDFAWAKPTWGPSFAIEFVLTVYELPLEGQFQNVLQFFSADPRFSKTTQGRSIPTIELSRHENSELGVLGVQMEVDVDLNTGEPKTKDMYYDNIVPNWPYTILMTLHAEQVPGESHTKGYFSLSVNGHKIQTFEVSPLIMYNTLGIFAGNGNNTANASIENFKYNNIEEVYTIGGEISRQSTNGGDPLIVGTAPSWSKAYSVGMDASISQLPDKTAQVANLFKLLTPSSLSNTELLKLTASLDNHNGKSQLPSMNIRTINNEQHWCVFHKDPESDTVPCALQLPLPEISKKRGFFDDLFNVAIQVAPLLLIRNEKVEYRMYATVNGAKLTIPDGSLDYFIIPEDDVMKHENVKLGLAANDQTPGFRSDIPGIVGTVNKIVSVGGELASLISDII